MIYLDNAATTFPKPSIVIEKISEFMTTTMANPGRSGHKMAMDTNKEVLFARLKLAELIKTDNPLQIAFTKNTSEALNMGILGTLKENSHIITTTMEHNSVARVLKQLEKENRIILTIVDSDDEGFIKIDEIEKSLTKNTSLVVVTHASNLIGSINDIEKIGNIIDQKSRGFGLENKILFMVDSAQTAGIVDIDVQKMKVDILAGAGHKSLYGPTGTGFLYIAENVNIKPIYIGGTGSMSESLEQPDFMPDVLETGTINAAGIVGLRYGIEYVLEKGIDNLKQKQEELLKIAIEKLSNIEGVKIFGSLDEKKRSGTISFNIGDMDSQEITAILSSEYDIAVRGGLHCTPLAHTKMNTLEQGMIRASFSSFNTVDDVEKFVNAIDEIASKYNI